MKTVTSPSLKSVSIMQLDSMQFDPSLTFISICGRVELLKFRIINVVSDYTFAGGCFARFTPLSLELLTCYESLSKAYSALFCCPATARIAGIELKSQKCDFSYSRFLFSRNSESLGKLACTGKFTFAKKLGRSSYLYELNRGGSIRILNLFLQLFLPDQSNSQPD